jgi:NADH-quinone oxidoreductase subunit F
MSDFDITLLPAAIEKFVPMGRSGLLPALHAAQKLFGWLPQEVAAQIAKALSIPPADVHGVIEFYSLFYNQPVGKRIFRVCTDPACALKGADDIIGHLCDANHIQPNQTTTDQTITVERSPCLGLCEHAPAAMVNDNAATKVNLAAGSYSLDMPESLVRGNLRLLTKNCGKGRATSLEEYGGYQAFKRVSQLPAADVITLVKAAGLVGRGGAAFPTGLKWEGARNAAGEQKYIVCNADESEPGTFKDRILLSDDPHRIIEGMCIAAHAIGASRGFIYLRGEYPYILPVLENALSEALQAGYLGENLNIEVRLGAGAYICGEETALFESIEGKRGFPRIKPPFPTTYGLFGAPTVINNVETLCNVPLIVELGEAGYRQIGTEKSPGPKLFCVSGDIALPGLYEVPFGITLGELLEMAGSVPNGKNLQAVLFGGAAGAFATPAQLDVRLTFEDLRSAGLPLGSGVVMVFDETRDLRDTLTRLGHFFAHESCGKCYPCQLGTQRQKEILERLAAGAFLPGDRERLQDIAWTMTDASLCGLGQTAASAVLSAMKQFPTIFIEDGYTGAEH